MSNGAGAGGSGPRSALQRLATLHGVDCTYEDAFGERRQVADETLVRILAALGEPLRRASDAVAVLDGERSRADPAEPALPPVVVAWDGRLPAVSLGPEEARHGLAVELGLEGGGDGDDLVRLDVRRGEVALVGAAELPFGIHELVVSRSPNLAQRRPRSPTRGEPEPDVITVISSPSRARPVGPVAWGLFAPVHALHEERASADLSCLERLGRSAGAAGAAYVATLPMLADFSRLDDPIGTTSPYSPISRLWWNEGYLDPARVPELGQLAELGELAEPAAPAAPAHGPASGAARRVDVGYRAAALRPVLEGGERALSEGGGERGERFRTFVTDRPEVLAYARFRAACEAKGPDWSTWPASWQHGLIADADVDERAAAAHTYAQFLMDEQVGEVASRLAATGAGIMSDLPVGCRGGGFDPWAYPESFAAGATIGAPPDLFFSSGQDWGFRPLHPEGERRSGYAVTAASLRHLLRHSAALRLDHAMGLSRLWWIPEGLPASEGAYVRYPLDEMLALCCLEAWRNSASLVGEDLGTVEASLTGALGQHGIAGMHVAVFDLEAEDAHPMEPLSPRLGSTALVDTHDTATFAGWFGEHDIAQRVQLGLLDDEGAERERASRRRSRRILVDRLIASSLLAEEEAYDPSAVHSGLLAELASSEAGLVVVNPEDCWGETDPQNIPGTTTEHANFCRPFRLSLDEMDHDEQLSAAFGRLEEGRRSRHRMTEASERAITGGQAG